MNDYEYSIQLVNGIRAEEELISRGYTKLNCPDCGGEGFKKGASENPLSSLMSGKQELYCPEHTCYCCHGRGWLWKAPTTSSSEAPSAT